MSLFPVQNYSGKRVCVALSGGVDSVCLLHAFLTQAAAHGIALSAVHVEHGIRGEESLRDMRFCEEICEKWGIPLRVERRDVPALAKGAGLEETARRVRYEIFLALLARGEADLVATAHHQNDVVETVLFRLARGTSLAGMRAIGEHEGIIRPLIGVPREQILAYAKRNSLDFVEDSTNFDESYTRNYIRRTVLPAFEKIHGRAAEHIASFAAQCARDDDYLTELSRREIAVRQGEKHVPVNLPEPLFLRACLLCLAAERDYTSANLKEIEKLKMLQSGKKVCLPGGQEAVREYGDVVFYRPEPPFAERPFTEAELTAQGLRADLDRFPEGCVVRTRREGDFIVPFGGRKKSLKKFFTDRKISARLGNKIRLVACGSEIFAVFGVEISDKVKITERTVRIGYFG